MSSPWERYPQQDASQDGPWTRYAGPAAAPAPKLSVMDQIRQNLTNLAAGGVRGAGSIGATLVDAARGLGTSAVNATPADMRPRGVEQVLQAPRGEELRAGMDGGLQAVGADPSSAMYATGKLGAEIAGTMGVGGALSKAAQASGMAAPLVEALATGGMKAGGMTGVRGAALRAGAGAAGGAATAGMVDPSQAGGGAAVGAVAPGVVKVATRGFDAAAQGVRGAARGVRAAVEPFTDAGRQAIAARTLVNAAGDDAAVAVAPRLEQAAELLPGSIPTAAQVAENGGVAALERAMAAHNPAPFAERGMEQAAARTAALREIAGDDVQRAAAVEAREAAVGDLYGQAKNAAYAMDEELQRLLQAPAMQAALGRAKTLAENNQRGFQLEVPRTDPMAGLGNMRPNGGRQITGQGLMDLKMAVDDMLKDPAAGFQGASGNAVRGLRAKLIDWMERANPAFGEARTTYAEMSKPVAQMDIGQELLQRLEPALADHGALAKETAGRYAHALRNADQTARKATGFRGAGMADVMTPEQQQIMQNIAADLARKSNAQELGRGVGSNTVQNLAMGNIAKQSGSPRAVGALLNMPVLRKIPQAIYETAEPKIQEEVVKALLYPKTAATMMRDELAKRALAGAPRQPMLSEQTRDAIELLFARTSPVLSTGQ